jgi:hypothetical protein
MWLLKSGTDLHNGKHLEQQAFRISPYRLGPISESLHSYGNSQMFARQCSSCGVIYSPIKLKVKAKKTEAPRTQSSMYVLKYFLLF